MAWNLKTVWQEQMLVNRGNISLSHSWNYRVYRLCYIQIIYRQFILQAVISDLKFNGMLVFYLRLHHF